VSASPDGSSTNMSVNNVSRSMTISGQSAASNTAAAAQLGSLTFDLSNPSAVQMSMFSGLSPAALHINAGPNPGMEISPNGNAIFRGPGGVTASTVNISSAFAAAREGSVAGSASAQISINGTTGNVEMKVGDEIVDRWTPVGITENGQAPNRIGGSIYNGVASGKFGATIGGGGSTPIPDGCDSDCTSVNPPDPPTCLNDCTVTHGNFVGDTWGTVGGGVLNRAEGGQSTVGGGGHNWAKNHYSTIAGGTTNLVEHPAPSPYSFGAIGGGYVNTVHGQAGTVPGGFNNTAGGLGSFAAGCGAKARGGEPGVFVWADAQGMPEDLAIEVPMSNQIYSTAPNQFIARSEGGFWFGKQIFTHTNIREDARFATDTYLQTTAGVSLTLESCLNDCLDGTPPPPYDVPPDPEGCARNCYAPAARLTNGGTWTNASDRNNKENITAVDAREVLEKVATMPIARWNYKIESDSTQHIGPMAQDFHAAFGLGDSEKSIATIDADGVALAAIQGLNEIVKEKDCRISELEERLAKLEALIQARETDSKDEGR